MQLVITPDGNITGIYSEEIAIHSLGTPTIERASDVEPDWDGSWTADLRRSGGPVLGPFENRSMAIEAEVAWLEQHLEKLSVRNCGLA
jgi:hypothetical protein